MSLYLCISTPKPLVQPVSVFFENRIQVADFSHTIFGKRTIGNKKNGKAYLLTVNGISHALFDITFKQEDSSSIFLVGLNKIISITYHAYVLVHWCKGLVEKEAFDVSEKSLSMSEFRAVYSKSIALDVRYDVWKDDEYR
jgi:hypothetical protein